jgi:hypothetical protein
MHTLTRNNLDSVAFDACLVALRTWAANRRPERHLDNFLSEEELSLNADRSQHGIALPTRGVIMYDFAVGTKALFGERYAQWANLSVPAVDLDRARAAITTMWVDEPGGWTYELSALAYTDLPRSLSKRG